METDSRGNPTKQKKIDGKNNRCVWLRVDDGSAVDDDGFVTVDEAVQEELPFV